MVRPPAHGCISQYASWYPVNLSKQETKMSTTTVAGEIRLKRLSPEYWRVTFDLPPLNIFGPANIPQLEEVVSLIETDEIVKVVVFDSAINGFFLIHYDFLAKPEESAKFPLGRTGLQAGAACSCVSAARRLSRSR